MQDLKDLSTKIEERVSNTIQEHRLFVPGERVIVGVSGGADSVALLHLLAGLRDDLKIELVVAHLNHGLRGEEADKDAFFVQEFADSLGLRVVIERGNVKDKKKRDKLSTQVAAREVRHEMFSRIAAAHGATKIALGHTQDDRVETILMRILRGTGIEGLSGFGAADFPIVRPLFAISRAETHAYCEAHSLAYHTDLSNADLHYTRNRVRAELLPHLAAYYNKGVNDAILRMATLAEADNALLDNLALSTYHRIARIEQKRVSLKPDLLLAEPLALQRRIVRQALLEVRGSLQDIGAEKIGLLLKALTKSRSLTLQFSVSGQIPACRAVTFPNLEIFCRSPKKPEVAWEIVLDEEGETPLPDGGRLLLKNGRAESFSGQTIYLLREVFTFPLMARSRQAGDRMRPRGLNGTKKIQDIFVDAKIPVEKRSLLAIITETEITEQKARLLWCPGLCTSELALTPFEVENRTDLSDLVSLTYFPPGQSLVEKRKQSRNKV